MPDTNDNRAHERPAPQPEGQRQSAARAKARRRRRRPLWLTIIIRIFQVIGTLLLVGIVTGCFLACYAAVYVKNVVMPKTFLDLSDYTMSENSVIYYQDKETGSLVELQTLTGKESRELVSYEQLPEDLINAYIAIEDKRFPTHNGVDWKRTAAGFLYMATGRSIQGGSTITQQLIKNVTDRNDVTVTRKILEIFTALELEKNYNKKDILEFYLNWIYLGNGVRGVQAASQLYFGKDVWDLDLAECASLAGITNNPSLYAPYGTVDVIVYQCRECRKTSTAKDEACWYCGAENSYDNGSLWTNREYNKARQELILREMANPEISPDGAYITEAERDAAIAETLVFKRDRQNTPADPGDEEPKKDTTPSTVYPWYVEAVINESIQILKDKTGLSTEMCEQRVFSGGLSIICAYDPEVQAAVDTVFNDRSNLDQVSSRTGQRLISAISIVDNSSGYVVAMGSTQEKTGRRSWNTPVATKRQPGSSIKPLSVYSPAFEMGLITPASVIDDSPQLYNNNIWPVNVWPVYGGLTTVMEGVTQSLNTVAVRVLQQVTPEAAYQFLEQRYGITSLEPYLVKSNGEVVSDYNLSPLAMGGLTHGVSTFEMAAAFATFPRNGKFTKATTVLEIRDPKGNVIDTRPKSELVIKETTAYYTNAVLTNAVTSGTGTGARISGQTVAGKTGTTSDVFDYWFCGYTSYYTGAVWTGYSNSEVINRNGANPSVSMWQKVMAILHEDKENQPFYVPDTLSTYDICKDCGKLATSACRADVRGSRAQSFRLFPADAPKEYCECHVEVRVCLDSPILKDNGDPSGRYHLAGEFCPEESIQTVTMVDFQRELVKPGYSVGDASALLSYYDGIEHPECDVHTEHGEEPTPPVESGEPIPSMDPGPIPSMDPGPVPSMDPGPTPDPVQSLEPFIPPVWSYDPQPTVEPPQPSYEPVIPPDMPYIPADG